MSLPGSGGLVPPPINAPAGQATPVGVQPGVSTSVVRARLVIVSGTGEGLFVYSGNPGSGNPPIDSVSNSVTDPYGNTTQPGVVSYNGGAFAQLFAAALQLQGATGQFEAASVTTLLTAGVLGMSSGEVTNTDTAAQITLTSVQSSLGTGVTEADIACTLTTVISLTVTGTLTVNGSTSTQTAGLPNGTISGTSGGASAGTAHTHGPGSFAVTNGVHSHVF